MFIYMFGVFKYRLLVCIYKNKIFIRMIGVFDGFKSLYCARRDASAADLVKAGWI